MITRDLAFADYLRRPGVHFSALKHMDTSAKHYRRAVDHERKSSPAQLLGAITHAAILTPDLPVGVAVYDGVRNGKKWDAFEADHGHLTIVKRSELEASRAMRAAALADPIARRLLERGDAEVTVEWTEGALPCRGRVDWLDGGRIVEVKTTRSIGRRAFPREVAQRSYHVQLAFYAMGLRACGVEMTSLPMIIAVENVEPYDVCVYRVGYDALEAGERKVNEWLASVRACAARDTWPGVGAGDVLDLRLPEWALSDGLEDVDMGGLSEVA